MPLHDARKLADVTEFPQLKEKTNKQQIPRKTYHPSSSYAAAASTTRRPTYSETEAETETENTTAATTEEETEDTEPQPQRPKRQRRLKPTLE